MTTVSDKIRGDAIRFVDFCAGLGGFHKALTKVTATARSLGGEDLTFTCVAAAELEDDLRECYVKNFPDVDGTYREFHQNMVTDVLGCGDLGKLDAAVPSFSSDGTLKKIHGDMRIFLNEDESVLRRDANGRPLLPAHDLLCAGFPCQPFSKSGSQRGFEDTRGTVFHAIATILKEHKPAFVLLENVGNFARHDGGNTWMRVRKILEDDLGYAVVATEHISEKSGKGKGLLSPHHLGYPHHRERFFMLAQRKSELSTDSALIRTLLQNPLERQSSLPSSRQTGKLSDKDIQNFEIIAKHALIDVISKDKTHEELSDLTASQISPDRVRCINHWALLLEKLDELDQAGATPKWKDTMPSFPIWGYELDPWNWYPADKNPADEASNIMSLTTARDDLIAFARSEVSALTNCKVDLFRYGPTGSRSWLTQQSDPKIIPQWVSTWPSYAGGRTEWPRWKERFIEQNRAFALRLWSSLDPVWFRAWLETLYVKLSISSYIKLEWNCKGDSLNIWDKILQFRPSGLRVKRLAHVPALVAMTTTQIPIVPRFNPDERKEGSVVGALGRHLVPSEALQLQGFPASWTVPCSRERAFTCFGNAVHVGVVHDIFVAWLLPKSRVKAAEEVMVSLF